MVRRILPLIILPAYGFIFVAYGHTGLPLALVVPFVLIHFWEADLAILWPSLLGTLGALFALSTLLFPRRSTRFRTAVVGALASLAISACGFILASEKSQDSLFLAVPFFAVLLVSALFALIREDR
jgi:uncharacterized membrane protein YfcA